jgi:cytoskeletal protein CcmA (bactofilin family)
MIDMKQIKENVSNKIKSYQEQDKPQQPVTETRQHSPRAATMAIGASIRIKGDVSGDEDLIIQGNVEGTVELKGHSVTISQSGNVRANINAKQIIVEGELTGDMNGEEKVIIRETGNVHGNIVSPRVTLEDGALFKGSIEMDPQARNSAAPKTAMAPVQNRDDKERQSA